MAFHLIQIFCTPPDGRNSRGCTVFRHNAQDVEASREGFNAARGDVFAFVSFGTRATVAFEDADVFEIDEITVDNFDEMGPDGLVLLTVADDLPAGSSTEFFVDADACDECTPPDPPAIRIEP